MPHAPVQHSRELWLAWSQLAQSFDAQSLVAGELREAPRSSLKASLATSAAGVDALVRLVAACIRSLVLGADCRWH